MSPSKLNREAARRGKINSFWKKPHKTLVWVVPETLPAGFATERLGNVSRVPVNNIVGVFT
jgi:hypothetical protein